MPSFPHEILVDVARKRSEVIRKLLLHCGDAMMRPRLEGATGKCESADLSQVAPIEYFADNVTVFRDEAGEKLLVAVVEVQQTIDANKEWTWPVYVTVARSTFECPCVLLVIAMEPSIARWARALLDNIHSDVYFHFVVVSAANVPRIIDIAQAKETPELAVLSAIAHPSIEVARAALAALDGLPEDRAHLYFDVILDALPEAARNALEEPMQQYEYKSDFARKHFSLGEAKGREAGQRALQRAALELAKARLETVTAEEEAAIHAFADEGALTALIVALGTTSTPGQARDVLAQTPR
jgi:hypothetical protein